MKEEIYRWVKTIAFFYIVFSAVLHLVPDVKYERYIRSFMGILLIYILSTPVFNLFGNGEKLLQEFRSGWIPCGTIQIAEYGTELFYNQ